MREYRRKLATQEAKRYTKVQKTLYESAENISSPETRSMLELSRKVDSGISPNNNRDGLA